MEKNELKALLIELFGNDKFFDDSLEWYHRHYTLDGKEYDVYLAGNDEMFGPDSYGDLTAFYQVGIDPKEDKAYKFFFEIPDDEDDLGCVDYDDPYDVKPILDPQDYFETILDDYRYDQQRHRYSEHAPKV